jgi:hypothetical protein
MSPCCCSKPRKMLVVVRGCCVTVVFSKLLYNTQDLYKFCPRGAVVVSMLLYLVECRSSYSSCGCGDVVCWNGYITIHYKSVTLQDGTCCKTVCVKKRYVFQDGTCCKTVRVTKRPVTKRYMLLNDTFFIL